jgi:hypothetical protein
MSNSVSAAKRRRANIVSSPLFQSNGQTNTSTPTPEQTATRQPMTLQQVIGIFDRRLLHLEDYVRKQMVEVPSIEHVSKAIPDTSTQSSQNIDASAVETIVIEILGSHFAEFNHRYEMLAEEIIDLKHIVMKLQSYTLDVNKTLVEERLQILSELRSDVSVQLQNMAIEHPRVIISNQVEANDTLSEKITAGINLVTDELQEAAVEAFESATDELQDAAVEAFESATDELHEAAVEAFESATDELQEAAVEAFESATDELQEAAVEAFESATDELQEAAVEENEGFDSLNEQDTAVDETENGASNKSKRKSRAKKVVQATWSEPELNA